MNFVLAVISAIVLFLYGLQAFTREIQAVGGDTLRKWLGRLTSDPIRGVLLGAFATAIVQSSSAVVALAISLVDSGILTFRSSLGIVLGANIGTTSTAWLVSMRLTDIGPFFIVLGTIISVLPTRFRILGKALFYFGFIFFGLDLVGSTLKPMADTPAFMDLVRRADAPLMGVLVGIILTALVQSSTIVTGLCIVMVQQEMLTATAAIPIVIGDQYRYDIEGHTDHHRNERGPHVTLRSPILRSTWAESYCFSRFSVRSQRRPPGSRLTPALASHGRSSSSISG